MKPIMIQEENITELHIECSCGCSGIRISDWEDYDEAFITYYLEAFQEKQKGWFRTKQKLSLIWAIIRGKEYRFYEVCASKLALRKLFQDYLNKVQSVDKIEQK